MKKAKRDCLYREFFEAVYFPQCIDKKHTQLLIAYGAYNARNNDGNTVLIHAVYNGNKDHVKRILEWSEGKLEKEHLTQAIALANRGDHHEIVQLLSERERQKSKKN